MNAYKANTINAVVLMMVGLWGYFSSGQAPTALIPVGFGVVLMALASGVKKENKVLAHIAVVLTLLIIIALIKPLTSQIGKGDALGILRIALMMGSSIFAMVFFMKSFRDARIAREAAAAK